MTIDGTTEDPRRFDDEEGTELEESTEASPQEQQDYDLLSVRARKIIFGPSKEKILTMLGSSERPSQAIGKVGAMIIKNLVDSAANSGRQLSPDAVLEASTDVAEDLNDLAKANGVFQYDSPQDEQDELADAILWGVKYYGDEALARDEISPEMQQLAQKQMEEGMASEQQPTPTPIAAGVNQAMNSGVVGNMMGEY